MVRHGKDELHPRGRRIASHLCFTNVTGWESWNGSSSGWVCRHTDASAVKRRIISPKASIWPHMSPTAAIYHPPTVQPLSCFLLDSRLMVNVFFPWRHLGHGTISNIHIFKMSSVSVSYNSRFQCGLYSFTRNRLTSTQNGPNWRKRLCFFTKLRWP